jgi:hypothetical protein
MAPADAAVTFVQWVGGSGECEGDGGAVACCCYGTGMGGVGGWGRRGSHDDGFMVISCCVCD